MKFKEKNLKNSLSYLNKIYSLTQDENWYQPTNVFGLKVKDDLNKRGFSIQPYWRKFNLPVRISRQAFVELGIMKSQKKGKTVLYSWVGGVPNRNMAINLLKLAYAFKNGVNLENIDYHLDVPSNVEKTIHKMVEAHTPMQKVIQETKKSNMVVIQENFDKLFNKFDIQEKEIIIQKTQNQKLIELLGMVLDQIISDGNDRERATKNREANYNEFSEVLSQIKEEKVSNKRFLTSIFQNSVDSLDKSQTIHEEIIKIRRKENLINLLHEVIEENK